MRKFAKIGSFSKVAKWACFNDVGKVIYHGTVKLHGTNAGIRREGMRLVAQSRNREITPDDDNMGFAAWVAKNEIELLCEFNRCGMHADGSTLYGEWIGPGINRGCAVNQLEFRRFVVFASRDPHGDYTQDWSDLNPSGDIGLDTVRRAPCWRMTVDFKSADSRAAFAAAADDETLRVEKQCPFGALFGIDGLGEGIVWTPATPKYMGVEELFIKTKGAKHRVANRRAAAVSDPEALASAREFVEFAVTPARLDQGIEVLRE